MSDRTSFAVVPQTPPTLPVFDAAALRVAAVVQLQAAVVVTQTKDRTVRTCVRKKPKRGWVSRSRRRKAPIARK